MRFGCLAVSLVVATLLVDAGHAAGIASPSLHQAIENADYAAIESLLSEGAELEERDAYGRTPLYVAARQGDVELTRRLLERGADPNTTNVAGLSPLHAAVAQGHTEVAELLLANCASVNARDRQRRSPLHFAAARGYLELTQRLVESNAALEARLSSGLTPYQLAISFDQAATRDFLRTQLPPLPPAEEDEASKANQGLELAAAGTAMEPEASELAPVDAANLPITAASLRPERPRGSEATLRFVQEKLIELGYDPGPVSGTRSAQTLDAVRSFRDAIGVVRSSERNQITSCLVDRLTAASIRLGLELDAAKPQASSAAPTPSAGF